MELASMATQKRGWLGAVASSALFWLWLSFLSLSPLLEQIVRHP